MPAGKKSKPSYLYAIVGVSLVLFLIGTLGWLMINGRGLSKVLKENVEVIIEMHDSTRMEKVEQLKAIIDKQAFTKSAKIVSKEEAAKLAKEDGDDFAELLDYNPLFISIKFYVHSDYVNPDSLNKIVAFAKQSNIVREVSYPKPVVEKIDSNFRKIGIILGGVSLLLFLIVIILIDNTVRLAMFSNRFLIKTMQMVGATRWFISKPFDRRAIINGLISGVVAVAGLWFVISLAESYLPDLEKIHNAALLSSLMIGMVVVGILITLLSTHRSVVKYLKMHVDDLY